MKRKPGKDHYDLLLLVNYYTPYISGLTEVARTIAEGCAARGWRVHVVAARHDDSLPPVEVINGVTIERTKVVARVRNGVVSPSFPLVAARRARHARVVNLHLPMLEAGIITNLARRRPVVTTYQCDYTTETENTFGRLVKAVIDLSSRAAFDHSSSVIVTSEDYARSSRVYSSMQGKEISAAPPFKDRSGGRPTFRRTGGLHVGALGRVVHEKGLDVLIRAFRRIEDPDARLLIAGDYARIAGLSVIEQLRELAAGDDRVEFLGFLDEPLVNDFFASLDVLAFPSVNPLEAFGIVQLEALSAGVPIVASDLPGVRLPVLQSGFGLLVPPGDPEALRAGLLTVSTMGLVAPEAPHSTAVDRYIETFEQAIREGRGRR